MILLPPTAYVQIKKDEYMEVFGLDFEQFNVGQVFRHRPGVTISAQDITDECLDTLNAAQIHYDAHYAGKSEFKKPLGVSTLTLQKCFGMAWKTFARKDRILSFYEIEMKKPVYAGATLYAESEVLALEGLDQDRGLLTVRTKAFDANGTEVCSTGYQVSIFKQGRHPFYGQHASNSELLEDRFSAFRRDEGGILVEKTGMYFDDFQIGETYHHRPEKYICLAESLEHAKRSMDWNPRYISPSYAKEYFQESNPPITEMYFVGLVTASTTRTFGRVVANLAWKNVHLNRLLYAGESVRVQSTVTDKRESNSRPDQGILTVTTTANDAEGQAVMSYERILLVYKSNQGPYAGAGY
jgi:itaconyl-CoA hydratase